MGVSMKSNVKKLMGIIAGLFGLIVGAIALIACIVRANYNVIFVGIILMVVSAIVLVYYIYLFRKEKTNNKNDE